MKTIYFAHPFDKMGTDKEKKIVETLMSRGYTVYDPFKYENGLNEKYGVKHYYKKPCKEFASDIIAGDFALVEECDELFAWIPKNTTMIGTIFEIGWAFSQHKKITVLCYKPQPFLYIYADVLYTSYEDFVADVPYKWKNRAEFEEEV